MEFWRGRLQKSGSDQWEDFDNIQDILDLQERMRKHGFDGGPGINKDRWTYNDEIFDFDRPLGPTGKVWKIKDEKYKRLVELLDKLDAEGDDMTSLPANIIDSIKDSSRY